MIDFESKIISREVSQILWEIEKTVGTAESCTGGRIAEALISIPGASKYFKGGVVSYVDEIKERLLNVDPQVIEEQTAVCEEVAKQMVIGACKTLNTDFAIAATGFAGPGGGTHEIPVGTIWIACGTKGDVVTEKIFSDEGRDLNIANATNRALQLFLKYLTEKIGETPEKY
jgi:nicotinamide-nucleotide amidase